jgi:hypothetical protein
MTTTKPTVNLPIEGGRLPSLDGSPSRAGHPAWRDRPSWTVVASGDKAAGADVVRSMAERAGAAITELEGSHVIMVSRPPAVTNVIMEAVGAVAQVPVRA